MQAPPINEQQLDEVLDWIDSMAFTRQKKNLNRDFSDGVLVAQILKQYFPQWVELHNYGAASSSSAKYINWKTLNEKVFKKLNFQIHKNDIQNVIQVLPGTIQKVLHLIHIRIKKYLQQKNQKSQQISVDNKKNSNLNYARELSTQLAQKQQIIRELRDVVLVLQQKLIKMEQLNQLKDVKIQSLIKKMQENTF